MSISGVQRRIAAEFLGTMILVAAVVGWFSRAVRKK